MSPSQAARRLSAQERGLNHHVDWFRRARGCAGHHCIEHDVLIDEAGSTVDLQQHRAGKKCSTKEWVILFGKIEGHASVLVKEIRNTNARRM